MRTVLVVLTAVGLLVPAFAADPKGEVVREIDVKGLKLPFQLGKVEQPTEITSAAELAKAIPDKEWQDKIGKEVDFTKQKLLLFIWSGSGTDKFAAELGKNGEVTFQFTRGNTRDLRVHLHLFKLPKDMKWTVKRG